MNSSQESTANRPDSSEIQFRLETDCRNGNWSLFNIAAMVLGFICFWPIGLVILFWLIMGRNVRELPRAAADLWSKVTGLMFSLGHSGRDGATDNVIFNEFQQTQYDRIREIRDEIKERSRRFHAYRADAKRRADEEEFNNFMSDTPTPNGQ